MASLMEAMRRCAERR